MSENAGKIASPLAAPWRRRRYGNAYCPLCGAEQLNSPLAKVANPEGGLCPGRCATAWQVLAILRTRESVNEALATRRQLQREEHLTHAASLSELLLTRWRAADWTVMPENLLEQLLTPKSPSTADEAGGSTEPTGR